MPGTSKMRRFTVSLDEPDYDELKRIPKGTRIEYTAWYDNSPEMAAIRGFDSNQNVRFGQASTDEMMMGFIMSSPVPEDERESD